MEPVKHIWEMDSFQEDELKEVKTAADLEYYESCANPPSPYEVFIKRGVATR